MNSAKHHLEILNHLCRSFHLATYAELPLSRESGSAHFNYIWRNGEEEIQLLIVKSELIHAVDYQELERTNERHLGQKKPYYFFKISLVQNNSDAEVNHLVSDGIKRVEEIKKAVLQNVQARLNFLAPILQNKIATIHDLMDGSQTTETTAIKELKEIRERLHFLKELMSKAFQSACDKWNIPNELVHPEDLLFESYQQFLNSNTKIKNELFKSWYQEFIKQNSYP